MKLKTYKLNTSVIISIKIKIVYKNVVFQ